MRTAGTALVHQAIPAHSVGVCHAFQAQAAPQQPHTTTLCSTKRMRAHTCTPSAVHTAAGAQAQEPEQAPRGMRAHLHAALHVAVLSRLCCHSTQLGRNSPKRGAWRGRHGAQLSIHYGRHILHGHLCGGAFACVCVCMQVRLRVLVCMRSSDWPCLAGHAPMMHTSYSSILVFT